MGREISNLLSVNVNLFTLGWKESRPHENWAIHELDHCSQADTAIFTMISEAAQWALLV
jgi:hypothetical protein